MLGSIYENNLGRQVHIKDYFIKYGCVYLKVTDGELTKTMSRQQFQSWRKKSGYKCVFRSEVDLPVDRLYK